MIVLTKSMKKLHVLRSIDNGLEHISISHPHRLPTWDEIKYVRDQICDPRAFYAVVLPPKEFYVNLHPYCMHIWQVKSDLEVETWKGM